MGLVGSFTARERAGTGLIVAVAIAICAWLAAPASAQQASTTIGGTPSSTGPTFPSPNPAELAEPPSSTGTAPNQARAGNLLDPQVADLPEPKHPGISQQGGGAHAQH